MARLFEAKLQDGAGEHTLVIDLEKVCFARLSKMRGQSYPQVLIRLVGGQDATDAIPPDLAQKFMDALRSHLAGH